jgi:mannose-6-phosphate isomerase-like protein (cupin superfamily)
MVAPGQQLGQKLLKYRAERWVVGGKPMINIGDETIAVPVNESVLVPQRTPPLQDKNR